MECVGLFPKPMQKLLEEPSYADGQGHQRQTETEETDARLDRNQKRGTVAGHGGARSMTGLTDCVGWIPGLPLASSKKPHTAENETETEETEMVMY